MSSRPHLGHFNPNHSRLHVNHVASERIHSTGRPFAGSQRDPSPIATSNIEPAIGRTARGNNTFDTFVPLDAAAHPNEPLPVAPQSHCFDSSGHPATPLASRRRLVVPRRQVLLGGERGIRTPGNLAASTVFEYEPLTCRKRLWEGCSPRSEDVPRKRADNRKISLQTLLDPCQWHHSGTDVNRAVP